MPRKPRSHLPDGPAHVIFRGVDRSALFVDDVDRKRLLELLEEAAIAYDWSVMAYCFMSNHVHLLTWCDQRQLSAGMHRMAGLYAQRFNRRHGRTGHLYEERFAAHEVKGTLHLMTLLAYVPLNPVRAGLCKRPEDHAWSSYRAAVGEAPRPRFLDLEWLSSYFGQPASRAMRRYADFCIALGRDR